MTDLIARSNGEFILLAGDGRVFDLVHADGNRRKWVPVETPFTAVKLAMRPDHSVFALDDLGNVWQRLPDHREHENGGVTVSAEWRQVARAPR